MSRPDILFLSNSTLDSGLSGGDVRFIELGKRFARRGIKVAVVSSREGVGMCKRLGLDASSYTIDVPSHSALGYLEKAWRTCLAPIEISENTVVYSCHDFICDVAPAAWFRRFQNVRWVAVIHWLEGPPWQRGFSFGREWVQAGLYNLNQIVTVPIARLWSDLVLAVSSHTAKQVIHSGVDSRKVCEVHCGVDHAMVKAYTSPISEKLYDALYLKSLVRHKGVYDAIEIWSKVCRHLESAKLAIVGFGTPDVVSKINKMIAGFGLQRNAEYLGPIQLPKAKFKILRQSRILLHPSYDENWAVVIGEAMACGVPVVAYGLPVLKSIWKRGMIDVPVGDKDAASRAIVALLRDQEKLEILSETARRYSRRYDWDTIADRELLLIQRVAESRK